MIFRNYSVATVPRGVLTWICQNPETYKPKCHHRRWFTRATSQSPCLHGTLRSAAITIKTRKACFYRLNAFWLVTVKVLNSYFNLTFHCTDHRALCKVFLHERVYTENRMLQTRYYSPVPVQQKLLPAVNSLLLSTSAAERSVPATVWCRWHRMLLQTSRSSDLLRYTVQLRRLPVYLTEAWFSGKSERIRSRPVWLTLPGRSSCFSA